MATGDVHAHTRERALLQDAFVAIREHTTLDASEPLRRGNHAHVLAAPHAMAARFADHPEAVAETARLAATLSFDLTQDLGYRYPGAEDADAGGDARGRLPRALRRALPARPPAAREGGGAAGGGAAAHRRPRAVGLLRPAPRPARARPRGRAGGPRRGDGARAAAARARARVQRLVHRLLPHRASRTWIPWPTSCFLGRFLNEEITALPDIDLDFPRDVREVLIPRIHERYGREHSALVAAFPTYRAKGAIRELGKALGLPPGEIERVARGSEGFGAFKVGEDVTYALGEGRKAEGRWAWLVRLAERGPRPAAPPLPALGRDDRLDPAADRLLRRGARRDGGAPDGHVGQGLVRGRGLPEDRPARARDALGRRALRGGDRRAAAASASTSRASPTTTRRPTGPSSAAETTGVFQIESRAQIASLLRTRPETLDDLTIQVAIVRPGPIQGGAVNPYIERRQRLRVDPSYEVPYDHPSLEPVLRDTLGTIIFQDQVIEVAMAFAGFSPGEAEGLRRAMSRKRSEAAIRAYHDRFVEGAQRTHGVDAATAERVYTMIVGFSGFGFPKAHGAAFGLLAYQSTWLRVHYAPEFLAALLDEQPMGFYPPDALVHEAQRRGLTVLRAGHQRERGGLHGHAGGRGADRAGLRPGRARRRGRRARRRPRGGRPVRRTWAISPRGRARAPGAGPARLVGRLRRAGGGGRRARPAPARGPVGARRRGARDAAAQHPRPRRPAGARHPARARPRGARGARAAGAQRVGRR